MLAGKDLNYDLLNYHLYSGLAAASDRLEQDFFPAGIQSYLNPYALLPLYWMVRAHLPALAIACVLATLQSVNLWLAYRLARTLLPGDDREAGSWRGAAVFLAGASPVFLVELGSSFTDSLVSIPVVAALLVVTRDELSFARRAAWSGLLVGTAVALKLTSSVYALALLVGMVVAIRPRLALLRGLLVYLGSLAAGMALTGGYWMYRLWDVFSNPFFPFFNGIFRAPGFVAEDLLHQRYRRALADQLLFPFDMAVPIPDVYTETAAPDIRFAVAVLLLLAIGVHQALARRRRGGAPPDIAAAPVPASAGRSWLLATIAASFVLWAERSGNGRYLMPVIVAMGPVLVWLVQRTPTPRRTRQALVLAVLCLQAGLLAVASDRRWSQADWGRQWLDLEGAEFLQAEPRLYLSVTVQSDSFLALYAHRDSSFVNLVGQDTLSPDGPGGPRLRELLRRFDGRVSMAFPVGGLPADGQVPPGLWQPIAWTVKFYGFTGNRADCRLVTVRGLRPQGDSSAPAPPAAASPSSAVAVCPLVAQAIPASIETARTVVSALFDRVEAACPLAFRPKGTAMLSDGRNWMRFYVDNDRVLMWNRARFRIEGHGHPPAAWRTDAEGAPARPPSGCPAPGWTREEAYENLSKGG